MKRALTLLLVLPLSVACRKPASPPPPAAAAAETPASAGQPAPPPAGTPAPPAAAAPIAAKPMPAQLPDVLAKVNGEAVERWEMESAIRAVEAQAGGPIPPDKRDQVLRGILDQLVSYHLLAQESRARKLGVSDAEVAARIGQIRGSFPTEEAFKQALATQSLTAEQLQRQTRTGMEVDRLVEAEINSRVTVQDSEVADFYQKNLERFKQGESVHASHILIGVPADATPETKMGLRARAEALLKEARGSADFASLARAQSQDQGSAANGGDLGFFPKGQMDPAFETAAFALKLGTISGIVETQFGFHIIKAHERRPPRTAPLAEVGDQIKEYLGAQQRDAKVTQFIEQAKAKVKVELFV